MSSALWRLAGKGLPLLAGVAVLLWLCRVFGLRGVVEALGQLQPLNLILYVLLATAVLAGYCGRWLMVSRAVGASAPLRRFVAARIGGDALGSLLPGGRIGGDPYRIALLYSQGVPGVSATAGVAADRMLEMTGNVVAAIAYVWIYSATRTREISPALLVTLLIFLGAMVAMVTGLWLARHPFSPILESLLPKTARLQLLINSVRRTEDALANFLREHPATCLAGLAMSLLIELIIVVEYHFLFRTFGLSIDVPTILLVLLGGGLSRAIPTPAGLGALEVSQVSVLAFTSGRPDVGFVVGLILRLHETFWLVLGLAAVSAYGLTPRRARAKEIE
jgi:uncharacterized protein (TIRG00374 family)